MKCSIGQNILKYRKKCNMTQADLAEKLNVSIQAVSKWENDISYPDIERIKQLANVLNTSADCIINGEDFTSITQLADNEKMTNRLLLISLKYMGEQPVDVTLRIPVELILKAHEEGTLHTLIGEYGEQLPDSVFEMITSGVIGPIADINTVDTVARIEVVKYDY